RTVWRPIEHASINSSGRVVRSCREGYNVSPQSVIRASVEQYSCTSCRFYEQSSAVELIFRMEIDTTTKCGGAKLRKPVGRSRDYGASHQNEGEKDWHTNDLHNTPLAAGFVDGFSARRECACRNATRLSSD